jgi:hypothetical protein
VPTSDDESSKGTNPEVVVYDPDTFPPDVNIAIKHGVCVNLINDY